LADYSSLYDDFKSAGVEVAAISVDDPSRSEPVRVELGLNFDLLSDSARGVVHRWGLLNLEEKGGIARPAVVLLDSECIVRYVAFEEVGTRVQPAELLEMARTIAAGRAPGTPPRPRTVWPGQMFFRATMNALRRGVRVGWSD
jgi:peroxiredoxin